MKTTSLLLLVACSVLAAPDPQSLSRTTRGNFLRMPAYETLGAQTYFVDGTNGNDATACTGPTTSACATIQGAINKIPKLLRHTVTVSITAGTYAGFITSGFSVDESVANAVGLLIQGTLANSTMASGSATGTATGGTAGGSQTFGTLVDSGATWTTNDLTGRLLCTSNTTVCTPIESNTSTTITIDGAVGSVGSGWVAPVGGVTYAIQDAATVVNTAATLPDGPLASGVVISAGIIVVDNYARAREGMVTFSNIQVANPSQNGMMFNGVGAYMLNQMQVRPTSATARGIAGIVGVSGLGGNGTGAGPQLTIQNSDVFMSTSSREALRWDFFSQATIRSSQFRGTTANTILFGVFVSGPLFLFGSEISGFTNGLEFAGVSTASEILNSDRINCGTYVSSIGIAVGNSNVNVGIAAAPAVGSIDHVQLGVCALGLLVDGPAAAELHGFTGSVGTTLIEVMNGGYVGVNQVNLTTASVQFGDGGTGQFFADLDNGTVTATSSTDFGSFSNSNICISNLGQGSRACGR